MDIASSRTKLVSDSHELSVVSEDQFSTFRPFVMSEGDENCDPVLLNSFVIQNKRCRVVFHRGILTWEQEGASFASRCTLPLSDVLAVKYVHAANRTQCCGPKGESEKEPAANPPGSRPQGHKNFMLHYAVQRSNNKLRHQSLTFKHTDSRQVASWVKTLCNYLAGLTERPRKVLLFVNPFGGKKLGLKIYEQRVKPLFGLAGIDTTTIVTERRNHAHDILLEYPLDKVDGVACVGGDGTFAEMFNGLLMRSARDSGVDPHDPDSHIPAPAVRVGVIPGGSTDTMAYCFHGTINVETAILQIILGDSTGVDLCSVHHGAQLLRYYSSVISYGYLGDVMQDSENFRWMGPKRYDYSGVKKFFANKGYEGELTVLADPSNAAFGPRCYKDCERCRTIGETWRNKDTTQANPPEVKIFRGKYFMVSGANVSCACVQSPNGLSPNCHLGDGCVDVMMIKHTHIVNNLRLLLTLSSRTKNVYELPFVEVHRAREFTFRAVPSKTSIPQEAAGSKASVWNCDGELQYETNVKIRVHCQILRVFTRRVTEEAAEEKPGCTICPRFCH